MFNAKDMSRTEIYREKNGELINNKLNQRKQLFRSLQRDTI